VTPSVVSSEDARGWPGAGADDEVRAERVAERAAGLHRQVALQVTVSSSTSSRDSCTITPYL
jgi:hypothetical protein